MKLIKNTLDKTLPAVRVDEQTYNTVKQIAESESVSVSVVQRSALEFFLGHYNTKRIDDAT